MPRHSDRVTIDGAVAGDPTMDRSFRCNSCHRTMEGTTAYDGACACGGLIEADPAYLSAYRVIRFYRDNPGYHRTIIGRCSLAQAQAHCSDPETSSSTATSAVARARTRRVGAWFDGYEAR